LPEELETRPRSGSDPGIQDLLIFHTVTHVSLVPALATLNRLKNTLS